MIAVAPFVRPGLAASLLLSSLPLFLAACQVGPDYAPPRVELPAAWHEHDPALLAEPAQLTAWWQQLGDPVLDRLVERAARGSLDVREALARVNELRALRGAAAAELWPSIDARAGYARRADSENTPFGPFAIDYDRFTLGIDASWELDLWGRVRRSVEAADADLQREIETMRAVMVSMTGEVASNYVQLRSLQQRIVIATANLALQQRTLALVEARFESGLVGERDVAQARANVATTQARVPALAAEQRAAENRLAVLAGLTPGALAAELADAQPIPVPPASVAVGMPADLLRRRPDVRAAERELAAATARIGVAEAELYPQLTLGGTLGLESDKLSRLFDGASNVLTFGPDLRWNVFDAGRVRARIAAQDARTQQALARWERTVLVAIEEVENAMTAFLREQVRRSHLADAATQARRAAELATTQYTEGLSDFQNVVDSERVTAELEDQLTQSSASITSSLVSLYRALGGGWHDERVPVADVSGARAR